MNQVVIDRLNELKACREYVSWAETKSSTSEAWDHCERPDWMLWLLGKLSGPSGSKSRKKLVGCALVCAKTAWKYVREEDRQVIKKLYKTVEDYIKGKASLDDVRHAAAYADASAAAAADAAYAAAYAAAYDAAYAATAAAYAAAAAYDAAAAYAAASAAAYAAADAAAYAAADAATAYAYAKKTAQITMCKIIRKEYPKAPRLPRRMK